ncbi:enhancer of mRNA-decapping protein 4-like isoform X2 [Typha angustifolia]|uniref:enhancer of mRNA-decapping protein 4-like isoform X2 n=1 Tax=Typha angustifolia TaxID=59011 RepID=UPI003C304ADB
MASPAGNPNHPGPFELSKLFKPPSGNPNPNPKPSAPPPFQPPYQSPSPPPSSGQFSYPAATPPFQHRPFIQYSPEVFHRPGVSYPNPNPNLNPNPNAGARLMQLLGNAAPAPAPLETAISMPPPSSIAPEFASPPPATAPTLQAVPSAPPAILAGMQPSPPLRAPSSKMPRGRHLGGDRTVYDVDSRLPGESQPPQLEVTPITKYTSDPGLVLGRQIAVNRTYIVYGLKLGNIRVLNVNTALRSLLRGHTQRVTDMAFFAEDVHLLASASVDGRVFIWKIDEGSDDENKPQITGKVIVAIQIIGDGESYHPRICWHSHKQEILFVGIGNRVLKIDTTKVGRGKEFTAEEPLKCPMEKLLDGVQLIGKHDGDVTELSISQWMTTRLASSSKDGTVKIWEDRRAVPLATLRPHDGQAVNSVSFLTSPQRPDHINLITAGPLNREIKLWASESEEGWLLPSDSESWCCTQTLDLRSSLEPRFEEGFFNQVVVLPRASLIILANAKKNAIYAVHVDFGPYPALTCMDYIADFIVAMPILSLTGTNECPPEGEQVVKLYCVQTMAIQQYMLDLSQCLPTQTENAELGREASVPRVIDVPFSEVAAHPSIRPALSDLPVGSASPKPSPTSSIAESAGATSYPLTSVTSEVTSGCDLSTSDLEVKPSAPLLSFAEADAMQVTTSPIALNFDFSGRLPAIESPSEGSEQGPSLRNHDGNHSVYGGAVDRSETLLSDAPDAPSVKEISGKGAISSSESTFVTQGLKSEVTIQDMIDNNNSESAEMEVKTVTESRLNQNMDLDTAKVPQVALEGSTEKLFKTSEYNVEMIKGGPPLADSDNMEEPRFIDDSALPPGTHDEVQNSAKDIAKIEATSVSTTSQSPSTKGKQQKTKTSQVSVPSSPSLTPFNFTDSPTELGNKESSPTDTVLPQISAMHDMLNQLVAMQKDLQKQMSGIVAVPVGKEGKRMEASLARSLDKSIKANADALWARFQEENAKRERNERDQMQQITNMIASSMNKDLPMMLERALKKELSASGPVVARAITPVIDKTISSAIADTFQRGIGDKAVNQLDKSVNSKLEATVMRQIQAQFQTSGKQALQDTLRSCLESSVVPAFEQSCRVMFEQVDAAFQKGMSEHTAASLQQLEAAHTPLTLTLREAINSASSITHNLSSELVDGQRKLLALVASGSTKALNPTAMQANNGPMAGLPEMALSVQQVEAPLDPTKELNRLISERKYEEAFTMALQRSDVSMVSWLCSQVDLHEMLYMVPLPLSQGVLLSLLQQLACDIGNETSRKVVWMTDVAVSITPTDQMISVHVHPIFEQVYNILAHQMSQPIPKGLEGANIRVLMHVINSVLRSCK